MGGGGVFAKAFAGGFFGKLAGALFIAICLFLGFGPDKWAKFIVTGFPTWVTPGLAQTVFLTLAAITFISLAWPLLRRRIASFGIRGEVAPAREQYRPAAVMDWKTPIEAIEAFGNQFIRGRRDRLKQEADEIYRRGLVAEEALRKIRESYPGGMSPNVPSDVVANYEQWHARLSAAGYEGDDAREGSNRQPKTF